jgi:hypothetical protein
MKALKWLFLVVALTSVIGCAAQDEESRTAQEHGGTLPWNRPQSWEGPGAMGSQMNQFSR